MAPRATRFAKRPEQPPVEPPRAEPRAAIDPTVERPKRERELNPQAVAAHAKPMPLVLAPLLQPYRKQGRLALRIERVPQLGRLSRGRNNGNGSWSVGIDEIEDLDYLAAPESGGEAPTLAVRVIGLDKDGATLTVLEARPSPSSAAEPAPEADEPAEDSAALRQALEDAQQALQESKENFERSLDARVAAAMAEAALALEEAKRSWQASADERLAAAELRWRGSVAAPPAAGDPSDVSRLNDELAAVRAALAANEAELRRAREDIADAQQRWQVEVSAAVAKAEVEWRKETRREAAGPSRGGGDDALMAELRTRAEQAESALEKARTRAALQAEEIAKDKGAAHELAQLKEKYAVLQRRFANREKPGDADQPDRIAREVEAAVGRARSAWEAEAAKRTHSLEAKLQAEADARLAKTESQWQTRLRHELESAQQQARAAEAARDAVARKLEQAVAGAMVSEHAIADAQRNVQETERRLADALARTQAVERERDQLRQQLDTGTVAARGDWLKETEERVRAVEARLNAEAEARLAAAEQAWRARALAEQEAALAAARSTGNENAGQERARLKQEVDAELVRARSDWLAESEDRLRQAQTQWKADAGARLSEAEKTWQARALAEQEAALAAARSAGNESVEQERTRLKHEVDAAIVRARSDWLAESEDRLRQAQTQWQAEAGARLSEAEKSWQARALADREAAVSAALRSSAAAETASSIAAIEKTWQAKVAALEAQLAAAANPEPTTPRDAAKDIEAAVTAAREQWARDEAARLAAVQAASQTELQAIRQRVEKAEAERDAALARAGAQQDPGKAVEAALAAAKKTWTRDEAARLADAKTGWRDHSEAALGRAVARAEAAERALAERPEPLAPGAAGAQIETLRAELAAVRQALADREAELAHARNTLEARRGPGSSAGIAPFGTFGGLAPEPEGEAPVRNGGRRLVRDAIVAAVSVMMLVLSYSVGVPLLPFEWQQEIYGLQADVFGQPAAPAPVADTPKPHAPAAIAVSRIARTVRLRAAASTGAHALATLHAGDRVEALETRGNWVHVRAGGKDGWVYAAYLAK